MVKRIAFLGPPGTFTEEATIQYNSQAQRIPFATVSAVASAVDSDMADEGVVPIENSLEGSVTDTLDLLIHESRLRIKGELVLPISHCFLANPSTRTEEIKLIYSHPQALGQCRRFIERCFPKAQVMAALSTAAAVEEMKGSPQPAAAIASRRAAGLYEVSILAQGIQDSAANVTRFVILSHEDHPPTGADKTSLCFAFVEDRPGILYSVLGEIAERKINLGKIESRPSKVTLGRYIFLVDLEGHREDVLIKEVLDRISDRVSMLKIFGSYPRYQERRE